MDQKPGFLNQGVQHSEGHGSRNGSLRSRLSKPSASSWCPKRILVTPAVPVKKRPPKWVCLSAGQPAPPPQKKKKGVDLGFKIRSTIIQKADASIFGLQARKMSASEQDPFPPLPPPPEPRLLESSADVEATDSKGYTPLCGAAYKARGLETNVRRAWLPGAF